MIDPIEDVERKKYEAVWGHQSYRKVSPGAMECERAWEVLQPDLGETLNDYGSGPARATKWFSEKGLITIGVDIASNAAETDVLVMMAPLWDMPSVPNSDYAYCCDVMEHIPPEKVDDVLSQIAGKTRKAAFFRIACRPDVMGPKLVGEPLHLTIEQGDWWKAKMASHWSLVKPLASGSQDVVFVCFP